jgi:hypothetical protein
MRLSEAIDRYVSTVPGYVQILCGQRETLRFSLVLTRVNRDFKIVNPVVGPKMVIRIFISATKRKPLHLAARKANGNKAVRLVGR